MGSVFITVFGRSTVSRSPSGSSGTTRDSDMSTPLKVAETFHHFSKITPEACCD